MIKQTNDPPYRKCIETDATIDEVLGYLGMIVWAWDKHGRLISTKIIINNGYLRGWLDGFPRPAFYFWSTR